MEIHVNNADELIDAFRHATASDTILIDGTILLPSQQFVVNAPLVVSDGVTLQGAGVMQPPDGLPVGFQGPKTTIKAGSGFKGNLVTLGNDSSLRRLILEGASEAIEDDEGRGGNTVAVASRRRNDIVSATIVDCELINTITSAGVKDAPSGGAILVYTRNPNRGDVPLPHEDAHVTLALTRSIIRTPNDGKAVFAMNFASRGHVTINLKSNNIGGPLDVIGGLARPDAVVGAKTTLISERNHYKPKQRNEVEGWQIIGGSTPPFESAAPVPNSNADSNTASANSKDDQIEDFQVGIVAVGGRRLDSNYGPCSNNTVNLTVTGMKPATNPPAAAAADFDFVGALSFGEFLTGDNNAVIVEVLAGTTSDSLFRIDVRGDSFLRARLPRSTP
jgi:hypothetical protein